MTLTCEELDNNSTEDYFHGKSIDWSKAKPLPPVTDGSEDYFHGKSIDWSKAKPLPPVTDGSEDYLYQSKK